MPSFDVVSEVDKHELQNVVDQVNREVNQRFDLKDTGAKLAIDDDKLVLTAPSEFQINQITDIFRLRLAKRGLDIASFDFQEISSLHGGMVQEISVRQGIDGDSARLLIKAIKAAKMKVQTSIQGDKVRVSGKKRDDLQAAMAVFREIDVDRPLQFENFRD